MTTMVRWEPFREIAALQNDMGRLMSAFLGQGNGETMGRTWVPAVDVWETEDALVYAFDLPGIPEDKITVEFEDGAAQRAVFGLVDRVHVQPPIMSLFDAPGATIGDTCSCISMLA